MVWEQPESLVLMVLHVLSSLCSTAHNAGSCNVSQAGSYSLRICSDDLSSQLDHSRWLHYHSFAFFAI